MPSSSTTARLRTRAGLHALYYHLSLGQIIQSQRAAPTLSVALAYTSAFNGVVLIFPDSSGTHCLPSWQTVFSGSPSPRG